MSSSARLPALWATNTNYSAGPDTGTPTKVDPASAANGFIKGVIAAPQHVNFHLDVLSSAGRLAVKMAALRMRQLRQDGETIDDVSAGITAISRNGSRAIVVVKANTNGVFLVTDIDRFGLGGTVHAITSLVSCSARGGIRMVVGGTGGNNNSFSDNNGASWAAGGAMGAAPQDMIYNGVHATFVAVYTGGTVGQWSADAVAWAGGVTGLDIPAGGVGSIAWLANGDTLICGIDAGDPAFSVSTDGGATWGPSGGTVPSSATHQDQGWIAGADGKNEVLHLGRTGVQSLVLSASTDGSVWTTRATISIVPESLDGDQCRLLWCPDTGLLVIAAPLATGVTALYASADSGLTWTDPLFARSIPIAAFSIAGGRLFCTEDDMLFASDGIGIL